MTTRGAHQRGRRMKRRPMTATILSLVLGASYITAACSNDSGHPTGPTPVPNGRPRNGTNRTPLAVGTVPVQELQIGDTRHVDLRRYFTDPDGDELVYSVDSNRENKIEASIVNYTLLALTATDAEIGEVQVHATDPDGASATQTIQYDAGPAITAVVWSKNGFDGESFEYKVNCLQAHHDRPQETCFLWNLDRVTVEAPSGKTEELEKDFQVQNYSGEITRRWVIYGRPGAGFPQSGDYTFRYYREGTIAYTDVIPYVLDAIGVATDIVVTRDQQDAVVRWRAPTKRTAGKDGNIKVIFQTENGETISQVVGREAEHARLPDIPMADGTRYWANIGYYFWGPDTGGYSYSRDIPLEW